MPPHFGSYTKRLNEGMAKKAKTINEQTNNLSKSSLVSTFSQTPSMAVRQYWNNKVFYSNSSQHFRIQIAICSLPFSSTAYTNTSTIHIKACEITDSTSESETFSISLFNLIEKTNALRTVEHGNRHTQMRVLLLNLICKFVSHTPTASKI